MADWMAKNRMNYWIEPCGIWAEAKPRLRDALTEALKTRGLIWEYGHHTFHHWITQGKRELELYGLKDGKRTPEAMCVSNPKAVEKVAANMAQFAREHPEVDVPVFGPTMVTTDGANVRAARRLTLIPPSGTERFPSCRRRTSAS